jgi:glycosyltransferase involved in cell wall biosynthesis
MRFLYIGGSDVFSRHELGFVAALSGFGELDVVVLGGEGRTRRLPIASDNGAHIVTFYEIPCNSLARVHLCANIISSLLNINDCDAVFATPRLPLLTARRLKTPMRVILRLWSIRAAKLKDNLRYGAYEDTLIFIPSTIANAYYILNSTYSIALDHATYTFAKKFYPLLKSKIIKVYPPYGCILSENEVHQEVPEIIDRGNYILGFTTLGKRGPYLKFEAKPHAIVLYLLAKRTGMDVVLAGSDYDDWKHVFPGLEPPRNLHIVGKGFPDNIVAKMYKNALLAVTPISNRNISNRLLEALFYGKPVVTSEIAKLVHPELEHGKHLFISTWDTIVNDVIEVLKDEDLLRSLRQGAREAYDRYFSTKRNMMFVKRLLST